MLVDFVKVLVFGVDVIVVLNLVMQVIGCFGMCVCYMNNCLVGIVIQKEYLCVCFKV